MASTSERAMMEGAAAAPFSGVAGGNPYLHWSPIIAGGVIAAAISFVLISFGSAIGLAVASPSASWRDTSSILALLGGIWLLLTSLTSFGLGGYLAGRLRSTWKEGSAHEIEFRDGVHGLAVWGLAVLIGASLAFTTISRISGNRPNLTAPNASTADSLLAFELDRLFRSDRTPGESGNDAGVRAEAARIITTGLGRNPIAADDRAYLVRLVQARTELPQPDAEARVNQVLAQAMAAVGRARRGAVILAFMIGASLMLGAAVAWLAAAAGGQHRDGPVAHPFWGRWEVDRMFLIRER
jgi:hypothetical protein